MKVTDFVKLNSHAYFNYYRCGVCYYTVRHLSKDELYIFPVPIEDLGNATIGAVEKAITLMRYIRKAIQEETMVIYDKQKQD